MDWRQRPAVPTGASLTGVSVAFSPLEGASGRYAFEAVIPFHNFPKIRGKQVSRPIDYLLREARMLGAAGVKEVNLIAQDLTSFGVDYGNRAAL